jgi:O-succinylbenzoic acid--CoA ligase
VRRLIVLEAVGDQSFVDGLRRAWDAGDAVFPLDPRLPRPAAEALLAAVEPGRPVDDGDALVVATSGTTGEPRGVVLTHDAVDASARATSARLEVDPAADVWLACLPLAHVGGLSVVTRALRTWTRLVLHARFDAGRVSASVDDEGVTLVSLVPTMLRRLDPGRFRRVLVGGSAPPPDRPATVIATYGMTETGSGVVYDGVPIDGVEVRVGPRPAGDHDDEIWLRGPMLLRAYRDGHDPKTTDGWLPTGDLGRWDAAAGRLEVFGRAGDVVITGGANVWPAAVEAVLSRHPKVEAVRVSGRDDPEWGQVVVATVVPTDPDDTPTLDELRGLAKEHLPPWSAPRRLELVDAAELPRTATGKVRRSGEINS